MRWEEFGQPPCQQRIRTGCRHCAAIQPAEPAACWWPLRLLTFCAALWFIFTPNGSGKARRGGQEPKTGAAAPSPPPGSSKHSVPASLACHWQGCHAPTKRSQPPWTMTTQRDRPPGPIWTSGNPTTTQGLMVPSSKGSRTGKTQAPTSLGASAREGCWHSGYEQERERQKKKSLSYLLQSHRPPPLLALRWRGRGTMGAERGGRREM